jgi:hypothetical protein
MELLHHLLWVALLFSGLGCFILTGLLLQQDCAMRRLEDEVQALRHTAYATHGKDGMHHAEDVQKAAQDSLNI